MAIYSEDKVVVFQGLGRGIGKINLKGRTLLIPEMNRIGSHLLAAVFRSFGVNAMVLETFKALDLGKENTSGKECFPCQITIGDILYFVKKKMEEKNQGFDPSKHLYFMPEADGPCRFGMYNKYQRIVLDSFPETRDLKIVTLTTKDGYALDGLVEKERVRDLRKVAYFSVVVGDILDRLLWRVRPYEKKEGTADAFIESAMHEMEKSFEIHGASKGFDVITAKLIELIEEAKGIIDPQIPQKPKIGIIGEIYVRSHAKSNQDTIRMLERYGGEVVNASIAEWMNYTSYDRLREAKRDLFLSLVTLKFDRIKKALKSILNYGGDLYYQTFRQRQIFKKALQYIDIQQDHDVGHLEGILKKTDLFNFDVGTEACLSIPGAISYIEEGFNGVVNVYPFTCMPSTITSAVLKPIMSELKVPYLDLPYDSSTQANREVAIRTFMYQATMHFKKKKEKNKVHK